MVFVFAIMFLLGLVGLLLIFHGLALKHRVCFLAIGLFLLICGWLVYIGGCSPSREMHAQSFCCPVCKTNEMDIIAANDHGYVMVGKINAALASGNKTLSSFFPSRGGYDEDSTSSPNEKSPMKELVYWAFHSLALVYMLSIFAAVFGVEFVNRFLIWLKCCRFPRLRIRSDETFAPKPVDVFWDVCDESLSMCESMEKDSGIRVFVLPESAHSWLRIKEDDNVVHELTRMGWMWIAGDVSRPGSLKAARRHFFLGADGHRNVARAEQLMNTLRQLKIDGVISIYVRAWPEADDDALYKWADGCNKAMGDADSGISVEIVREEAIVARRFLIDHPMLECPEIKVEGSSVSGKFRLLLVGFGVQGERLMDDMICDAQFLEAAGNRVPVSVDAIDSESSSYGWFSENCPDACQRYGINFRRIDVRSEEFWKWFKCQPAYNRIVICTQDDVTNIKLANDIANCYGKLFEKPPKEWKNVIFVRVRNHNLSTSVKASENRLNAEFGYKLFGDLKETYSANALLNDRWNTGAIFVNGVWSQSGDAPEEKINAYKMEIERDARYGMKCWRNISTFDKESSIASLLHQRNLFRLIGGKVFEKPPRPDLLEKEHLVIVGRDQIESIKDRMRGGGISFMRQLEESEHLRWMAYHFVRGWKMWSPSLEELRKLAVEGSKTRKVNPNSLKKKGLRSHANLVDFDQLDSIDELFDKVNREIDANAGLVNSKHKDTAVILGLEALFDAGFTVTMKEDKNESRSSSR